LGAGIDYLGRGFAVKGGVGKIMPNVAHNEKERVFVNGHGG
jgi:hypothetical protein